MKRTKEQGITLIALVITIVVILVLAGATLATLTGNSSIIDNANYAVEEYNKSADTDQNVIDGVENLFAKYMGETEYTITYNANGGTGTMEDEEASRTATSTFSPPEGKQFKEWNTEADGSGTSYAAGARVLENVDLYAIWYDPLSAHVQPGDYITYNPTLGVTNASLLSYTSPAGELKIKKTNSETYAVNEEDTDVKEYDGAFLLIDDDGKIATMPGSVDHTYIYYTEKYEFDEYPEEILEEHQINIRFDYYVESDVPGNGYGEQTFTATASNILWRVLDVDETTGIVKIIPETPVDYLEFDGLRGYKNAARELNNISAIFGYGDGANEATSLTIEDLNKLTEYSYTKPTSVTEIEMLEDWYNTYYYYRENDYGGANDKITNMLYKKNYWLASTCVRIYNSSADFSIRQMYNEAVVAQEIWIASAYDGDYGVMEREERSYGGRGNGIMPLVTLKATVEYLGGNGEQATPWIFQAAE